MASPWRVQRSKEAPMDFQFTSRPSSHVKPVWAAPSGDDPSTPRKRSHNDLNPPAPMFPTTLQTPNFGTNQNVPFIFQASPPHTPHAHPWVPPPSFSPAKAFPQPVFQEESRDVDMTEASPPKFESKQTESERPMALGGMRRVFKSRQKARGSRSLLAMNREGKSEADVASESDDDDTNRVVPVTQNSSTHYTLNMPSAAAPQSDMPQLLLGYLQFFFNLSLILLFLYLVLQFILTVQRDVEQRISEYSMDIVQEIALCSLQYKSNLCASNPIPAMAHQCGIWETCMNRDPTIVGRAKVGAELIAEVVNGFVEPISWKTLAFTLTSLSFLTVFINTLLSLYRSRHSPIPVQQLHQPIAPVTPHPFGGYLSPAPTPSLGRSWTGIDDENVRTPTRRRRLEGGEAVKVQ